MVVARVRQFVCGLHGHDALLHFEHGRISLQCPSCGYETPGWNLGATNEPAAAAPSRVAPLVGERRAS